MTEKEFLLEVRVVPNASRTEISGWVQGALKVRVQAPPEGGRANVAVATLLARALGLGKREVRLLAGEKSRAKLFALPAGAEAKLPPKAPAP